MKLSFLLLAILAMISLVGISPVSGDANPGSEDPPPKGGVAQEIDPGTGMPLGDPFAFAPINDPAGIAWDGKIYNRKVITNPDTQVETISYTDIPEGMIIGTRIQFYTVDGQKYARVINYVPPNAPTIRIFKIKPAA